MVKKIFYLFVITGFIGACTNKTGNYIFENNTTIKVDESKLVLTRFPSQAEAISDSLIATLNSYQQVSLYNIYSGKNTTNFSIKHINFDSLIKNTFQKKYKDEREYIYDPKQAQGISGAGEQVKSFQHFDNKFYIHVSTIAEVHYLMDSSALLKYNEDEKIKQLKKQYGNVNMQIMDYINFLFVTDDQFNLEKIIPLYESPTLKKSGYYPIYERAFTVDKNYIYTYLMRSDEAYETMRSPKMLQSAYIAKINLKDEKKAELLLDSGNIDFSGFSIHDYYASPVKLFYKNNTIIYSNSKELCEVESGKKLFSRKNLRPNEWIASCYIKDENKIVMVTYNMDKKKHPSEFEEKYAVDSISNKAIKVFDINASKWVKEEKVEDLISFPIVVTENKIVYFTKDKQSYFFNYIKYDEN